MSVESRLAEWERAVSQRDAELGSVRRELERTSAALDEARAGLRNADARIAGLTGDLGKLRERLDAERRERQRAIETLERQLAADREAHRRALAEARAAHEARHRQLQEELAREQADRAADRAEMVAYTARAIRAVQDGLRALEPDELDRLELSSEAAAVRGPLAQAEASSRSDRSPVPALSSAVAAQAALAGLRIQRDERQLELATLRAATEEQADALAALVRGAAVEDLADHRDILARWMANEQACMLAVIDAEVRARAARLRRWNGKGAEVDRRDDLAALLRGEILRLRRAATAIDEHGGVRWRIPHLSGTGEGTIAGRFGTRNGKIVQALEDEHDPKSTLRMAVPTDKGEVRVRVPWVGDVEVSLGGRTERFPSYLAKCRDFPAATAALPEMAWVGGLYERWARLAAFLRNPNARPSAFAEQVSPLGADGEAGTTDRQRRTQTR